jgi:hypothetical protein
MYVSSRAIETAEHEEHFVHSEDKVLEEWILT